MKIYCHICDTGIDFPGVFSGEFTCNECQGILNDDQVHYIVYMTTCQATGMKYIGKHILKNIDDDSYLGSGTWLKSAIKLYGRHQFSRKILNTFDTEIEMCQEENRLITQEIIDSPDYYNLKIPGGRISSKLKPKRPTLVIYNDTIYDEPIHICIETGYREEYVRERLDDDNDDLFLYYREAVIKDHCVYS